MNTFGLELARTRYLGIRDNMFRWEVTLARATETFQTSYGMGYAHCTHVPSAKPGVPTEPVTRELARALKLYGTLTISDLEGVILPTAPVLRDVLYSLSSDARAGEHLLFEDFCSDFGYDTDSRKAEQSWRACQATRGQLQRLLGSDFEEFMTYDFDEQITQ